MNYLSFQDQWHHQITQHYTHPIPYMVALPPPPGRQRGQSAETETVLQPELPLPVAPKRTRKRPGPFMTLKLQRTMKWHSRQEKLVRFFFFLEHLRVVKSKIMSEKRGDKFLMINPFISIILFLIIILGFFVYSS